MAIRVTLYGLAALSSMVLGLTADLFYFGVLVI